MAVSELGERRPATQPAEKPVGIFRAIVIAHRTTWQSPQFYVLVVGAMQLLLTVIAIPVIRLLYKLVLVQTGLGNIAYDRISHVLRNPLADITLLIIAIVTVIAIVAELVTLFVLAFRHQSRNAISLRLVLRQLWETIKKLAHLQSLLMIVYLILLLPLGQLGLTSILTKKVAVPPFISEELNKSPSTSLIYSAVLLVISYISLRLIFTLPLLGTTTAGVWKAFVTSWRLTRWRALAALLTIMTVQSLTAMMRDWLRTLDDDHRPVAAVLNHRAMLTLVNSEETEVLAHRGFIQGGVENTLPALQAAARAGADSVEFDVMETKDGKFVVMHDANLKRLAGKNLNVKDLTQDELTKITVRAHGMEAKIPSLEEWIQLSIQLNLRQLLEIKLHGGETHDLVLRLLVVLDRAGVTNHYAYHTLSRQVVEELKRLRPELVVGFIVPINFGGVPNVPADFIVIEQQSYSPRFVRQAWAAGYNVIVWTVDDEQQMRDYMDGAVDGIITDRPNLAVAARTDIADDKGLAGRLSDAIARSASF